MSHVRQQIRDYVGILLTNRLYDRFGMIVLDRSGEPILKEESGLTTANLYKMRKYALDDSKLPAICVYTTSETSSLATIGTRKISRNVEMVIEVYNKASSTSVVGTIDQFAAEIAAAVQSDYQLGGLCKSSMLTTSQVDSSVDGEQPVAFARLAFTVNYHTLCDDAEVAQ